MKHVEYYKNLRSNELDLITLRANDRILDVGCGEGNSATYLKTKQKNISVIGVEPYCKNFVSDLYQVYDMTIESFLDQYTDDHFDVILCLDVLEHIWNYDKVLQKLTTILKPRGTLLISVPNTSNFRVFYELFIKNNFPKHKEGIFDETHCRWFTSRTLAGDLQRHGFTSVNFSFSGMEAGKILYFVDLITLRLFRRFLGFQVIAKCTK